MKDSKVKVVTERWEVIEKYVKGMKVLDIGCAELAATSKDQSKKDRWIHGKIKKIASSLLGLDINRTQIDVLNKLGFNVKYGDAESFQIDDKFEVIVAGELLEHLSNPGTALENMKDHLVDNGKIVFTTPNRFDFLNFIKAFKKNEIPGYHKDIAKHVFYFDKNSLKDLLTRHKLRVEEITYFWTFGKNYDRPLTKVILKIIAKFRPAFTRGIIVIATKE